MENALRVNSVNAESVEMKQVVRLLIVYEDCLAMIAASDDLIEERRLDRRPRSARQTERV